MPPTRFSGRVAVKAANLLRGKEKAIFTPHVDAGDFVVVINADKVRLAGKRNRENLHVPFRATWVDTERVCEAAPRSSS